MRKEYFIGERLKYGVTLMETVRLEEKIPDREIYKVRWTTLTNYKGINVQTFPMVRINGEFSAFTGITKSQYNAMLAIIRNVSEELQPLLDVKRQIDEKICKAHDDIWGIINVNS